MSFLQIAVTQASSGKALKMFGATFNNAARQTDYTRAWNAFAINSR